MNGNKARKSENTQLPSVLALIGLVTIASFVLFIGGEIVQSLADPELYLALANGLPPFVVGVSVGIVFGVAGAILILNDAEGRPPL